MGGWLLDTNIISELRKRQRANAAVVSWIQEQADEELFLSVATFGEIRVGIERLRLRDPRQAASLNSWVDELGTRYQSRTLDATLLVFEQWGHLQSIRPLPPIDALLAATAITHDLTLVTRNLEDFRGTGLRVLDPFSGENV